MVYQRSPGAGWAADSDRQTRRSLAQYLARLAQNLVFPDRRVGKESVFHLLVDLRGQRFWRLRVLV